MWQQYDPAAQQGLQISLHVINIIEAEQPMNAMLLFSYWQGCLLQQDD